MSLKGDDFVFVTFINSDEFCKVVVTCENRRYTVEPFGSIEVPLFSLKKEFTAELIFPDFSDEFNKAEKPVKFTEKVLHRLAKKFTQKLPEMTINTQVTYELMGNDGDCEVIFNSGGYSSCDGEIADLVFDMMPVCYAFAQAETNKGTLSVTGVKVLNKKAYLKIQRRFMLFMDWGLFLPDLFLFIPKYSAVRFFYASDFYISRLIKGFYKVTPSERAEIFRKKEVQLEKVNSKGGCFLDVLKVLIFIAALIGIALWALSGDAEVVVSSDYSTVTYLDEIFVKTEGGLPQDAEKVFFGDFYADYPETDGTYDTNSHYVYLYVDSKGDRYLWLKTDYDNAYNRDKPYEEYGEPLVYKAIGENDS